MTGGTVAGPVAGGATHSPGATLAGPSQARSPGKTGASSCPVEAPANPNGGPQHAPI
jgi:hypothetical protein